MARSTKKANGQKARNSGEESNSANRPWPSSVVWSAITMAVLLFVAVAVNVLVGRVIHWEIVTGLGVLGFFFLSIGRRYRTI